ncbi:uncharacterized protein LOC121874260 isoform X2 [Homarus americanus]|uniref:uncharacterized protein LOC121874260 isoform X2 n=1 Tax=Homarus americanus TaxID=6706 RepID=UPI001C450B44|nr:uncharacterized protein LOC121874260 isoform X2 [Homarus americanus]
MNPTLSLIMDPKMAGVVHMVVFAGTSHWDKLIVASSVAVTHSTTQSTWIFEDDCHGKESCHMSILNCSQKCHLNYNMNEILNIECIEKGMKKLSIKNSFKGIPQLKCKSEGLHFSLFLKELKISNIYRLSVYQQWLLKFKQKYSLDMINEHKEHLIIRWTLEDSMPYIIDYEWCNIMKRSVQEKQHLNTIMSWLSTLGGACSALGDYSAQFAERAGTISLQQLDIAFRLGDPLIVSRCRLYAAISLIQQHKFKVCLCCRRESNSKKFDCGTQTYHFSQPVNDSPEPTDSQAQSKETALANLNLKTVIQVR